MVSYSVLLGPDPESGGFTVRVPQLPEIVTEGDTEEEALANARDAIELLLEEMTANGEAIPVEPVAFRLAHVEVGAESVPVTGVA